MPAAAACRRLLVEGRGAVTVVMAALTAVALLFALLATDVALYVAARARAQVAADAAALAAAPVTFRPFGAAGTPAEEAARFAAINGAVLAHCDCPPDRTWRARTVSVSAVVPVQLLVLGDREAAAWSSAEFDPTGLHR